MEWAGKASRTAVLEALEEIIDPDLGINIVDLGLVYRVDLGADSIHVEYTLTSPGCPAAELIDKGIRTVLSDTFGSAIVSTKLTWEPLWGPERMNEAARVVLGLPV